MEERDEIIYILHNKELSYIDRLIQIDKMISGEQWDAQKIADSLDVPVTIVMADPEPLVNVRDLPKPKVSIHLFKREFMDCYKKIKKEDFMMTKMDKGQLMNISKVCDFEKFRKMLNYLIARNQNKGTMKLEFEVKSILSSLTPVKIYKNLNFLNASIGEMKLATGWGYSFMKKKGDAK